VRMLTRNFKTKRCVARTIVIVGTLWVLGLLPLMTWAAPSDLPVRPTPAQPTKQALPDRPTPEPGTRPDSKSRVLDGGFIELQVQLNRAWTPMEQSWQELWTVVQWQDHVGGWQDVEGWQGTLDGVDGDVARKVWWVSDDDLGTGPFRWVVYQGRDGDLLIRSESFDLPRQPGEVVVVDVPSVQ